MTGVGRYRVKIIEVQAIQVIRSENYKAIKSFVNDDDEFERFMSLPIGFDYLVKWDGGQEISVMPRELFEATFMLIPDHEPPQSLVPR